MERLSGEGVEEREVVTSFLEYGGRVLILRRSKKVGTYRGKWAGVSGYLEGRPEEQAIREIEEEVGLSRNDVELVRRGEPLSVTDEEKGIRWVIHPFLFRIRDPGKIEIDWEHTEVRWIEPRELKDYETVPALIETLKRVYP